MVNIYLSFRGVYIYEQVYKYITCYNTCIFLKGHFPFVIFYNILYYFFYKILI
jgi:hypothetical protein